MFSMTEAIGPSRIIPQAGNLITVKLFAGDGITTYPPSGNPRPCIDGDVLSIQPDGTPQGRVAGSNGPYEVALNDGSRAVWAPPPPDGPVRVWIAPLAPVVPTF